MKPGVELPSPRAGMMLTNGEAHMIDDGKRCTRCNHLWVMHSHCHDDAACNVCECESFGDPGDA